MLYEYANYLVRAGHSVSVLHLRPSSFRAPGPLPQRLIREAAYVVGRRKRPTWFELDRRVDVRNHSTMDDRHLPESDVLIASAAETADFVYSAAKSRGIPGAYFLQHYEDWHLGADFVDATWRLPLAKIVIAPWLERKAHDLGVQATLVPNAINSSDFPPGPAIAARPRQVLALVSPIPWKRTDLIAEVMKLVEEQIPDAVLKTFGVMDKPQELADSIQHTREPTKLELSALYQDTRVYLCASDGEGWHLPPAEAMSSGCAVVSTDIDGVRAYADGIALFSPLGDAAQLAANVVRLLADPVECQERATAGRERLESYGPLDAAAAFERELLRLIDVGASS